MSRGRHNIACRRQAAASGRERTVIIPCDGAAIARMAEVNHICRQFEACAIDWFGV